MSLLEREDIGGVAVIKLNRPKRRNALSGALVASLRTELAHAAADDSILVIVLTGNGPAFCAGGDLADGLRGDGPVAAHQDRGDFAQLMAEIPKLSVPVIAAVNGDAMGGGFGLLAACDLAVCDVTARLGTPEIRLGLFPWIILAALQRDVPRKILLEWSLTGARVSAERAREVGLVNRVAAEGQALPDALELARQIADKSPLLVSQGKAAFHRIADQNYEDALAHMHGQLTLNLMSEDAMEGISAFLQKREPVGKGR